MNKRLSTGSKLSTILSNLLDILFIAGLTALIIASCSNESYANHVHPHGELALVGYSYTSAYSPLRTFFMRNISMHSHVMAKLERDIFICAGSCVPVDQPFSALPPNYLVVIGKASINSLGAH